MAAVPLTTDSAADRFGGLTAEVLIESFRTMHLSRRLDDREVALKRQNRIFFQISGAGHEAFQVATALSLRAGHDWIYPYYRDRALCLALGATAREMLLAAVGAAEDPASGGRQMPSHWGFSHLRIVSSSSPTGTQYLQAVGCAEAERLLEPESDAITVVSSGDGATSEGEFWESLNAACMKSLPVLYLVQDNGYAISVPIACQTAGGSISKLVAGFPGLKVFEVDGLDFVASYRTAQEAVAYCRSGHGPALIHAHVIRPYSHSLSDDERLYKTAAERAREAECDAVMTFPKWLVDEGVLDRQRLQLLLHDVDQEIHAATDYALDAAAPAKTSYLKHLYSPKVDPASDDFETPAHLQGEPRTMVDAINQTLAEEMRRNPRIVVFGEDVADCSKEENLKEVKGKGGVFKATAGLQIEFGSRRVFNAPLAEAAIAGRAIGMATRGLKPVV